MDDPNYVKTVQFITDKRVDRTNLSGPFSKLPLTNYNSSMTIHDAIRPVYKLLNRIFLWPYRYSDDARIVPLSKKDKVYSYIFLAIWALWFCLKMRVTAPQFLGGSYVALGMMNILLDVFVHALVFLSVALTRSKYGILSGQFYSKAEDIRKQYWAPECGFLHGLRRKVVLQMKIILPTGAVVVLTQVCMYMYLGSVDYYLQALSSYGSLYVIVLNFFQINAKLEILLAYFEELNRRFSKMRDRELSESNGIGDVDGVSEVYNKLCDLVAIFNEAHGWEILLTIVSIVSLILAIFYGVVTAKVDYLRGEKFLSIFTATTVADVGLLTFFFALVMKIIINCSRTTKEASKTGLLANEALVRAKRLNSHKSNRKELKMLIEQVSYRNPRFSAAGICNVDMTIIPAILGAITSYFIVLLQFRNTQSHNCTVNATLE